MSTLARFLTTIPRLLLFCSCLSPLYKMFSPKLLLKQTNNNKKYMLSHSVVSTLCNPMDWGPPGFSVHEDSPGKSTGVGCHAVLQGIFPIQGSNPGVPHCRQILYHLRQQESPRILEWVAYSFSRRSSLSSDEIRVSCIAGRFFTV